PSGVQYALKSSTCGASDYLAQKHREVASEEEEDGLSPLVFITFLCQPAVGVSLEAG
ncbi:Uveal autoantigen with coiled-coil domains and ankyrin repeat, partial [Dissostichus eleginoides]